MRDKGKIESEVDEAALESFPASDPPSWTLGTDAEPSAGRDQRRASVDPFTVLMAAAVAIAVVPPLRRAAVRIAAPIAIGYFAHRWFGDLAHARS